jgi:hypothetical protein
LELNGVIKFANAKATIDFAAATLKKAEQIA